MDACGESELDDPFEGAIDAALESLPAEFRSAVSNVAILVEDEPPGGLPLLGLYMGMPLTHRGWQDLDAVPSKVSIYRGPITRLAAGDDDCLRREVKKVLLQELAHHFGIE